MSMMGCLTGMKLAARYVERTSLSAEIAPRILDRDSYGFAFSIFALILASILMTNTFTHISTSIIFVLFALGFGIAYLYVYASLAFSIGLLVSIGSGLDAHSKIVRGIVVRSLIILTYTCLSVVLRWLYSFEVIGMDMIALPLIYVMTRVVVDKTWKIWRQSSTHPLPRTIPLQTTPAKLLDVVALLEDKPSERLVSGQVGTIVEVLAPEVFEVEFLDSEGGTIALVELGRGDFLVLRHDLAAV